jgi:hypothetical protein
MVSLIRPEQLRCLVETAPAGVYQPTANVITSWTANDGTTIAVAVDAGGVHHVLFPGNAAFVFDDASLEVIARVDADADPALALDTFKRTIVPLILQTRGWLVLHASGVATPAGVIAICAPSEAGKSTLAWALVESGYSLFADDAVAIRPGVSEGGRPVAHALWCRPRLRPTSARHFGVATDDEVTRWHGDPSRVGGEERPLTALIFLRRSTDGPRPLPTRSRLIPASEAFTGMAANAYAYDVNNSAATRNLAGELLRVAATIPAFELTFSPGLEQLPGMVAEVIQIVSTVMEAG